MFAGKPFVASIVCLQAVCCGYSNIIFGRRFVADKVVLFVCMPFVADRAVLFVGMESAAVARIHNGPVKSFFN